MEIRGAEESELEELVRLQHLVFRPDEPDAYQRYRTYVREDRSYRLDQSRVVVDDGRIVAHLRVWDRRIRVRGAELRVGGIGSVLTRPGYRGRGYAKALMRQTQGYLRDAGYDLGLLFTIIGTPFYASLGWTPIPLPTFQVRVEGVVRQEREGTVRRLITEQDLEDVQAIYQQCCEGMTGPEVRSERYWLSGPSRYRSVFPTWGAVRDNQVVAYVNVEVEKGKVWVKEACALPGMEAGYENLAREVIDRAQAAGVQTIEGSLPNGHGFTVALAGFGKVTWGMHDETMVKLANWDRLVDKLGDSMPPVRPHAEEAFWQALFGQREVREGDVFGEWMSALPKCVGPFYWWTDIF